MTEEWTQTLGAGPLLSIAVVAIAIILFLVIKLRVHAFLTLVIVSLLTAIATGLPLGKIVDMLTSEFGKTLGSVALLIGLGAVLGKLIESSGGAKAIADMMVRAFGEKNAAFALGVTSLILGFPIFFDAGLVVMLPIIFAVARRLGGNNLLLYGITGAAAFSVMHVFLPPHPGPVSATELYGANLGIVLLVGIVVVLPTWYLSGQLWGRFISKRIPLPVPALFGAADDDQPENPPKPGVVIAILLIPIVLILLNTGLGALGSIGAVDPDAMWVQALSMIGTAPVALLISATCSRTSGSRSSSRPTSSRCCCVSRRDPRPSRSSRPPASWPPRSSRETSARSTSRQSRSRPRREACSEATSTTRASGSSAS
jgi:GntP family gluconate:H+ symporter